MKTSLILGFFDGVHIAHREVILSAVKYSKINHSKVVLVTLKDSPTLFFYNKKEYIYEREKTFEIVKNLGVEEIIAIDFENYVSISGNDYLKELCEKYNPISISSGFNHTFGNNKTGTTETLKINEEKYGYKFLCVEKQKYGTECISSTLIKNYLREGNIDDANKLLCNNFQIEGIVIKGNQLGRTIGFPTANIKYPESIVKIPFGVYKSVVKYNNESYNSIVNWGIKPTLNHTSEPIVEVHLLNYEGNLYGERICIEFLNKIRDEQKFNSLEELKKQIQKDIKLC